VPILAKNHENIMKQQVGVLCFFRRRETVKKPADHCRCGRVIFYQVSLDFAAKADFLAVSKKIKIQACAHLWL